MLLYFYFTFSSNHKFHYNVYFIFIRWLCAIYLSLQMSLLEQEQELVEVSLFLLYPIKFIYLKSFYIYSVFITDQNELINSIIITCYLKFTQSYTFSFSAAMYNSQMNELLLKCLEILHLLCASVDGLASTLANRTELIMHLFKLLPNEHLFL